MNWLKFKLSYSYIDMEKIQSNSFVSIVPERIKQMWTLDVKTDNDNWLMASEMPGTDKDVN